MPRREDPDALADELRSLVWDLSRRFRVETESVTDLPPAQQVVLARLAQAPGLTSAELARAEYVRPQSMSVTVAALREAGLVRSTASEEDARRRVLTLTPAGEELLARIRTTRSDWLTQRFIARLDDDGRRSLGVALGLLREVMTEDAPGSPQPAAPAPREREVAGEPAR